MNLQEKAQLSQYTGEMRGETKLPQLYTKSLSCLSAHHFSDSDNSTKSMQHPCGGTGCEVSELTSHVKNMRDQLRNEHYWIYTQIRGVWEELGPKSAAELCVNPALCLSMVLLPGLPAFHTVSS